MITPTTKLDLKFTPLERVEDSNSVSLVCPFPSCEQGIVRVLQEVSPTLIYLVVCLIIDSFGCLAYVFFLTPDSSLLLPCLIVRNHPIGVFSDSYPYRPCVLSRVTSLFSTTRSLLTCSGTVFCCTIVGIYLFFVYT